MDQTSSPSLATPRGASAPAASRLGDAVAADRPMDVAALAAVISGITGVGLSLSLSLPLLSIVLEDRGVAPSLIGLNTAVGGVSALTVLPFVAVIAKRFGTARVIITCFLTVAVTLMGFYYVHSYALWFPLRFVFTAAMTLIFALTEFWINSLAPPARRGLVLGIYATFLSIGISVGPVILALVGTQGVLPFLIGSLALVSAAAPVIIVRTREPALPDHGERNLLRFVRMAPLALFAVLVFGAVESGGTAILPLYGTAIGLTGGHAVVLVSAIAAGNVLSQIPIGYLADRVSRRLLLVASAAIGAAGALMMPLVADIYWLLLALLFITGGIVAGLYTIGLTHLGARYTGAELASANAAFVMMYSIGMLIGPLALGSGLDFFPPHGFPIAIALIFGAYVAMACVRISRSGLET